MKAARRREPGICPAGAARAELVGRLRSFSGPIATFKAARWPAGEWRDRFACMRLEGKLAPALARERKSDGKHPDVVQEAQSFTPGGPAALPHEIGRFIADEFPCAPKAASRSATAHPHPGRDARLLIHYWSDTPSSPGKKSDRLSLSIPHNSPRPTVRIPGFSPRARRPTAVLLAQTYFWAPGG